LLGKGIVYLDTDHSGLNKFTGHDDENFRHVSMGIQAIAKEASETVRRRFEGKKLLHAWSINSISKEKDVALIQTP
jgi:hypothetical protein